ncbi:MAG: polysaccharide deacetylase family protein [Romboutsia sp.]|uniref:polysaccharide deacetylase family protein n=1 Tax=Romboutsia sp. TaxID=1965302 RepID=UPI003F3D6749
MKKIKRTKVFISSIIAFMLIIGTTVALVYGMKYIYVAKNNIEMPIYKVDTEDKKIALTFDVAWGSEKIDYILDTLDKHNIKATFFLVGSWIDDNEELVKRINEKGHELSNHSNTHADMTALSTEDITKELEATSNKIYEITGQKSNLYRPPFGEFNKKSMEVCDALGYKVIKWDVDSLDWKEIGPMHVTERVIKNAKSGSIVLMHSNVENMDEYLDTIITRLQKDGYELVPVSELVYDDNYTIDSNGVQKLNK